MRDEPQLEATWCGETRTLRAWADYLGVSYNTLYRRHSRGWPRYAVIGTPIPGHHEQRDTPTHGLWEHLLRHVLTERLPFDPRWLIYRNFLLDVGERPTHRHHLLRTDPDLPYRRDNVTWLSIGDD